MASRTNSGVERDGHIRVLYVEDSAELAAVVKTHLERRHEGFEVDTVTNPERVPALMAREAVDCVVSDQHMPAMTGLDLLATLRDRGHEQPFILYTSDRSLTLDGGTGPFEAVSLLCKDVGDSTFSRLATRIRECVGDHQVGEGGTD